MCSETPEDDGCCTLSITILYSVYWRLGDSPARFEFFDAGSLVALTSGRMTMDICNLTLEVKKNEMQQIRKVSSLLIRHFVTHRAFSIVLKFLVFTLLTRSITFLKGAPRSAYD